MFDFNHAEIFSCSQLVTPSHENGDTMSLEDQIEYIAKVSNPAGQANFSDRTNPGRLTQYLIDQKHWSPLQMVSITMMMTTVRDIGRQVLRHRAFTFQEFSQRYAKVTNPGVMREARSQDTKNRQNSNDNMSPEDKSWWLDQQGYFHDYADQLYREALHRGVAKEVARVVLPEGMTSTTFYMQGTARDWFHYVQLRCGNGTQAEHKDLAEKAKTCLRGLMPNIYI